MLYWASDEKSLPLCCKLFILFIYGAIGKNLACLFLWTIHYRGYAFCSGRHVSLSWCVAFHRFALYTYSYNGDGVTYKEKVEVTLPNIILVSDSAMNGSNTTEYPVIEYDLLAGDTEPGESRIYSTDGSATISIRNSAENFMSHYISFVNSYNTYAEYEVAKTKTNDTQGVAALVQADKSLFFGCSFSGYQDTLYAQVGRHYFYNCVIEGRTDYIFGYDATSYFEACTVPGGTIMNF